MQYLFAQDNPHLHEAINIHSKIIGVICLATQAIACTSEPADTPADNAGVVTLSRSEYAERLEGFWLGQSIANWTGLVTEMDKIGGDGPAGEFYTRDDWGTPDQPSIWSSEPSALSPTIDWVFEGPDGVWGADDDTDLEYLYQHLLLTHQTTQLTGEQIRDGWLRHIYSDDDTPFTTGDGEPENFLWVSNQRAFDLMSEQGAVPPETSDPQLNPHFEMIDAQLTTEIFGLFAPARPDVALRMAYLPIRTTINRCRNVCIGCRRKPENIYLTSLTPRRCTTLSKADTWPAFPGNRRETKCTCATRSTSRMATTSLHET